MSGKNKKMDEILKQLEYGVQEVFQSKNFQNYLRTMTRFHHYSANNSLLIWLQKPDATYVAGFARWANDFKRYVKKGEKGIRIIVPILQKRQNSSEDEDMRNLDFLRGFRCSYVFDVSQTEGKDFPTFSVPSLQGENEDHLWFIQTLTNISLIPVFFQHIDGEAKGYYDPNEKCIVVSKDCSKFQQAKTLVHEIAHSILHSKKEDLIGINCEIEAESVAYCVCSYFGMDTSEYSFPYIAGWSKDKTTNELCASLERIRKTSTQLIQQISLSFCQSETV